MKRNKVSAIFVLFSFLLIAIAEVKIYPNCKALNEVYPHGVGKPGAIDKVANERDDPVSSFTVNLEVYDANKDRLDRDNDGIACEKH